MRNDKHAGEEFGYTTARGEANAYARIEVMPERPMREAMANDVMVLAAQLVEAVRRAPEGVGEATGGYIAYAVGLLHDKPSHGPNVTRGLFEGPDSAADACTGMAYVLLIKCLCTGDAGVNCAWHNAS